MNVLSLFDGMSCGRIALERAGIPVTSYFASEIDKYAIAVSQNNWTDITHIGDVTKIDSTLVPDIDLLIGGSPCQGFSFAGKQLNFNDPRSALFFEYVRILKDCKPKYFFLENVVMKQEYQDVISEALGVEPIKLNAALVSAQNRRRLYWTNIPYFGPPADEGILLRDILQTEFLHYIEDKSLTLTSSYRHNPSDKEYLTSRRKQKVPIHSDEALQYMDRAVSDGRTHWDFGHHSDSDSDKSSCITSAISKGVPYNMLIDRRQCLQVGLADDIKGFDANRRVYSPEGKSPTLISSTGGHKAPKIYLTEEEAKRGFEKAKGKIWHTGNRMGNMDFPNNPDKKAKTVSSVQIPGARETNHIAEQLINGVTYRKLTTTECERLQNVPDGYTSGVSDTQAYKMLGNGWEIKSIVHFFKNLNIDETLL